MSVSGMLRRFVGPVLAVGAAVSLTAVGGGRAGLAAAQRPAGPGAGVPPPAAHAARSGGAGPALSEHARSDTVVVGMTNGLSFTPEKVSIEVGQTVVWRNTSALVHTVTARPDSASDPAHVRLPEGVDPFGSGRIDPGGTYRHTFTVPGTYDYFCIPHEATGMTGTVVVKEES